MEYVFGTKLDKETLKVKSPYGTDLRGWQSIKRETDVDETTDDFRVIRKYKSETDVEGNHYDWYEIEQHNRVVDKSKSIQKKIDALNEAEADTDALMVDHEMRLVELELGLNEEV